MKTDSIEGFIQAGHGEVCERPLHGYTIRQVTRFIMEPIKTLDGIWFRVKNSNGTYSHFCAYQDAKGNWIRSGVVLSKADALKYLADLNKGST